MSEIHGRGDEKQENGDVEGEVFHGARLSELAKRDFSELDEETLDRLRGRS